MEKGLHFQRQRKAPIADGNSNNSSSLKVERDEGMQVKMVARGDEGIRERKGLKEK